jgi:EAL domain-containing protein (putative c-di-GMP-specific phosphodiesterase class I)
VPNTLLSKVLAPGAISTVFQPIYKSEGAGFVPVIIECLSRGPASTNAAHAGVLFEYAQLKAAEPLVDRACISAALDAVATIHRSTPISLNVFAATLVRDVGFIYWIADQMQRLSMNPAKLVFEIVEHGEAWDTRAFLSSLRDIRALGSAIALDDVGLAHSNFQRILECDPDFLKLDQCIVRNCDHDTRRQALLKSLGLLAKDLGSKVIAEGVETNEELSVVSSHGIALFQGFLFSRPVPLAEVTGLLDKPIVLTVPV